MIDDFIPNLKIESNADGTVTLESEWSGNVDRVSVHPTQFRYIAEKLGLIKASTAADGELLRDLDRLKRNFLRVRGHALQLQHNFVTGADWDHADLTFEMGQINTLVDLLDMAVDDFADDFVGTDPEPYKPIGGGQQNPAKTQRVNASATAAASPTAHTSTKPRKEVRTDGPKQFDLVAQEASAS